jgi:hypothetical protein
LKNIVLTTINAKWIHPSLALRLLKANLGELEDSCKIIEFALRQPLTEKIEGLAGGSPGGNPPKILAISVSIWNHTATLELLQELEKIWTRNAAAPLLPTIILGGPEVSHLPTDAKIFRYADYVIRGEGEIAFRKLCEDILPGKRLAKLPQTEFIDAENIDVCKIKSAYHLYTNLDLENKFAYVEASRGCPFSCEFCLSSVNGGSARAPRERFFPLEPFLAQMDDLIQRGARAFKFLDRTFNSNIKRALQIMEFFLEKTNKEKNIVVHFEMVPSLFPQELREMISRFPPGSLRLEIGLQTLNPEVAARIGRKCNPEKELETIRYLREKTHAIIHADLIAGLPGEDLVSFGAGFDRLWQALQGESTARTEIQLGILKLLPGAPVSRHNESFGMRYSAQPPYEIEETSALSTADLKRIKNYARFWELIINRHNFTLNTCNNNTFNSFLALSDSLFSHFGRNWGIDKQELLRYISN